MTKPDIRDPNTEQAWERDRKVDSHPSLLALQVAREGHQVHSDLTQVAVQPQPPLKEHYVIMSLGFHERHTQEVEKGA